MRGSLRQRDGGGGLGDGAELRDDGTVYCVHQRPRSKQRHTSRLCCSYVAARTYSTAQYLLKVAGVDGAKRGQLVAGCHLGCWVDPHR